MSNLQGVVLVMMWTENFRGFLKSQFYVLELLFLFYIRLQNPVKHHFRTLPICSDENFRTTISTFTPRGGLQSNLLSEHQRV